MRILDLGCGTGRDLAFWGVTASDEVTGLDIRAERLEEARRRFPQRSYFQGPGEAMPFRDASFDRVISLVALPYMDIPKALGEIRRVLVPGGTFTATLHPLKFSLAEFRKKAFVSMVPTLYRSFVLLNGIYFHSTGRTLNLAGRGESFQTERGMRIALGRAGFDEHHFRRVQRPAGEIFVVEASASTRSKPMAGVPSLNARAS
jgi:ubiquinone/menaquinone biosynthesis C-methylase UbiE